MAERAERVCHASMPWVRTSAVDRVSGFTNANTGEVIFDQFVYDQSYTGGVRVATGDVNGDGIPDLIVGAGIGGGPHIQVFDGATFQVISSFFAYEDSFRGGVYLSTADVNGDGNLDIIVGSGDGGGPVVRIFDGQGNVLANFFAFDESFRGGVRVTASDMTGDGIPEIITAAGTGGSPWCGSLTSPRGRCSSNTSVATPTAATVSTLLPAISMATAVRKS